MPTSVGVMILSNAVLFPGAMLPLRIFEPRYRRMLKDALASHRMFCVAMQRPGNTRETPLPVAGLGVIRYAVRDEDGTSRLLLQGIARVELGPTKQYKPYRLQVIRPLLCGKDDGETPEVDALRFKAGADPKGAAREAAKAFESLFMQELMKSMRASTMATGMFDNEGSKLGVDMLDSQLATRMAGLPGGLSDITNQRAVSAPNWAMMFIGSTTFFLDLDILAEGMISTAVPSLSVAPDSVRRMSSGR